MIGDNYIIIFILIIILYCLLNTVSTNQIPLNQQLHIPEIPKFFLQPLLKIHFKTFTKIHHTQWFIDIGYVNLATRNKQSIIFQYDMICQTKDCKNWYFCFSNKHIALGRKNKVGYLYFHLILDIWPIWLGADLTGADLTWGRFDLLQIWPTTNPINHNHTN